MSLSDCEKCWDTPCVCGWGYRNMTLKKRIELASAVLGVGEDSIFLALAVPINHPMKKDNDEIR